MALDDLEDVGRLGELVERRTRAPSRAAGSGRRRGARGSCRPAPGARRASAPQTASAASRVAPPREDGQPVEELRARAASSRSWLQAIAARSVRWRSGASRAPPVSSGSRRRAARAAARRSGRRPGRPPARSPAGARRAARRPRPRSSSARVEAGAAASPARGTAPTASSIASGCSRYSCSAWTCSGSRLVTRIDESRAGRRAGGDVGGRVHDLLEVVEHQEQRRVPISPRRRRGLRARGRPARARRSPAGRRRGRPRRGRRGTAPEATPPPGRDPGLAAAAGAAHRHQPDAGLVEQRDELAQLPHPADERRRGHRERGPGQGAERREALSPSW